jgi:hypothetical protein
VVGAAVTLEGRGKKEEGMENNRQQLTCCLPPDPTFEKQEHTDTPPERRDLIIYLKRLWRCSQLLPLSPTPSTCMLHQKLSITFLLYTQVDP